MSAVVMPTEDGISKVGKDMVFKKKNYSESSWYIFSECVKKINCEIGFCNFAGNPLGSCVI